MLEKNPKNQEKETTDSFWERFQFLLTITDNTVGDDEEKTHIVCQRYFNIGGFNIESIRSVEFKDTLDYIVGRIQDELVSKSRVYEWYTTNFPLKMNGFCDESHNLTREDIQALSSRDYVGLVKLSDGTVVNKSYIEYKKDDVDDSKYADVANMKSYDVFFKFSFLMDDKALYERIWDATV
ncbi:MAG: hypothetical protein J6Y37_13760 [Paludibacteraceae bacterium]|nr:hypothetical protein [Paludibacteraceae bacterium]